MASVARIRSASDDDQGKGENCAFHAAEIGTASECARPHRSFVVPFRKWQFRQTGAVPDDNKGTAGLSA
jgi:hypothetical protein